MQRRPVNVIHGKKGRRLVVVCQSCPLDLRNLKSNQKTSCLYLIVKDKKGNPTMKKEQECQWYAKDSILRGESGVANVLCLY